MSLPRLFKPLAKSFSYSSTIDKKRTLFSWFEQELGNSLLKKQQALLQNVLPKFFGYHLIFSGHSQLNSVIQSSPIGHKVFLDNGNNNHLSQLTSDINFLPFQSDSADLLILQHTLDYENDPFQILREASRVILPNGNLIIIGFNPWSLWGIYRAVLFRSVKSPWNLRFISPYRMSEWLDVLGFDIVGCESDGFTPPNIPSTSSVWLSWMENIGRRWLPQRGAFYCLVARKRISCITPVKMRKVRSHTRTMPLAASGKVLVGQFERRTQVDLDTEI